MGHIKLYDANNIDCLNWPNSPQGQFAKDFLLPLIHEGSSCFVKNVQTKIYALTLDEFVIPITVNNKEYANSYVASSYCSVPYLAEKLKRTFPKAHPLFNPLLAPLKLVLKGVKINKMVTVNNWLFSTNLFPPLSETQVKTLTTFLTEKFPHHYLMFRSIHTLDDKALYSALKKEGYRLIGSREIYAYDPALKEEIPKNAKRKIRKDISLLKQENFEVIDGKHLSACQIPRVLQLYHNVYRDKYSALSPNYSEKFLAHAIQQGLLKLKVIRKQEKLVGVMGYYSMGNILTDPFFGYDTSLPQDIGLYRMTSILPLLEADRLQKIAHVGSGGEKYKKWRGLKPHLEYIAVYDKHLRAHRKAMWFFSEKLMNHLVMPLLHRK